ncbi:unnamed protein product [Rangifer tarandus platyrhynchus]|uniref:Uncharacterized protein n=2 Tax=Rangifer tarandus platyrhynchus TaxID=3082113 RepID=A0ABN8YSS6_RANTA|nr:unnamed protein product [Rangifer tarandus platyrhynchus]
MLMAESSSVLRPSSPTFDLPPPEEAGGWILLLVVTSLSIRSAVVRKSESLLRMKKNKSPPCPHPQFPAFLHPPHPRPFLLGSRLERGEPPAAASASIPIEIPLSTQQHPGPCFWEWLALPSRS